ncbi:alpha and gamma adaptin binding protein p34 [Colletotrichum plurivorum]|uniref:Alpha and gamma adaptin binding protein p34 n=1 Tax=Colletotrichum plurivorum TaxID=2175906 RepID=A0A8H6KM64_9PEZI|nr:alpha and gamma adaptin binding protein p34 [Colletotrichum plurivorum]
MEVKNPRRVLAVSLADSTQHLSKIIKDLTGAHPEPASTSLAGTTHVLPLKTSYYTADVPVWLDLIGSPAEWSASFLSDEAKEVLSVLGGLAVVFALPTAATTSSSPSPAGPETTTPSAEETRALITEVGKVVREGLGGWSWDGVSLGVGVGEGETEEWEDLCAEWGLEFVQVRGGKKDDGRNEFGEKMGISRVLEALEANDWTGDGAADVDSDAEDASDIPRKPRPLAAGSDDEDEFDLDDPESLDFGFDKADFEGLKQAIWNFEQEHAGDDEATKSKEGDGEGSGGKQGETQKADEKKEKKADDEKEKKTDENEDLNGEEVEKLERMMRKLQAVRDMSAGLPLEQRRKMAKKAVGEVMKDL